ncbi:MAG: acetyl-CoA carboxylase biotin carboxyl carrier protein [Fimbriimonadaceae bacterium]
MSDLTDRIDELADLMEEFGLTKARLKGEDWSVEFDAETPMMAPADASGATSAPVRASRRRSQAPAAETPKGQPVSSPMTGIFYDSPSPGADAFVKPGDEVEAGQVVGLIEAMKVFNEITATLAGKVSEVKAKNGELVQPGDPILFIE